MKTKHNRTARLLLAAGLFLVGLQPGADEIASMWGRIYARTEDINQKHEIILSMIELDNQDLAPVFADVLEEMVQQKLRFGGREQQVRQEIMLLTVKELGDLRAGEAAPVIYKVVQETDNATLKKEAILALGNTGVGSYAPRIATVLKNLNFSREGKRKSLDEEKIALGCITALERLKDPVGYEPVFFAVIAGFSQTIQNLGKRALPNILADPTEILISIMRREADPRVKLLAVEQADNSSAPAENKLTVAMAALQEGLTVVPSGIPDKTAFRELRKKSIRMVRDLEADIRANAVSDLGKVLYLDTDIEEHLYAVDALSVIATDDAVTVLSKYLALYNDRRTEGMAIRNERVIKATIIALGNSGSRIGYEELLRAKYAGYSTGVEIEADKALQALSGR